MKKIFLPAFFQLIIVIAFGQAFQVGNKVEIYNSGGWYKGSILQIGTGDYKGYYYVHNDQYSQSQWIKESNVRLLKTAAANSDIAKGPRNGEYIILSYGSPTNPIRIGYFQLKDGQYIYYNMSKKVLGHGSYTYNSKSKNVEWENGPFSEAKWAGNFEIDREGKTHKIRLNRVTIGSNSIDSN